MGFDLVRDSTVGQILNYLSSGRILPYPEQRPGYVVPRRYLAAPSDEERQKESSDHATPSASPSLTTLAAAPGSRPTIIVTPGTVTREASSATLTGTPAEVTEKAIDPFLVDWEENDPDHPLNWSSGKRIFVAFSISLLTFSVYIGSAIYTSSIPGLMVEFNISLVTATLGLTLYVLAYGIGPMFLTPLQELPMLGRNPVYMITLFLWVVLQIPILTAKNFNTILAMRFLTGMFGSPALATGGSSMGDIYRPTHHPYALGIWSLAAVQGPILGPVIGGFAAQAKSWKWPILELIWLGSFSFVFLCLFLPETHGPTILLRRAKRLRALTGNMELKTATERVDQTLTIGSQVYTALVEPLIISFEPVVLFCDVYMGFCYAMFYLWFEAFPLVFTDIYHFNQGLSGLPFLGFMLTGTVTYALYCVYNIYHINPRAARAAADNKELSPEVKLEIGLFGSIFIPTSILIFGFTSKASIHWIVSVIGASLYLPGIYLIFQSLANYLTTAYPGHETSVLAANALYRSVIASVFPLFGRPFFRNLGLGPGSALLAGLAFLLMGLYWVLLKYAHIMRRRSKYARSD
ncbi:major facilitator superfamily domain-containing protein [Mycena metata]|uniref:Major facilitator superfamily domain-containing protein n=1 Tax=Mycena metata TaxID=1033252 RepID=A0AAD7P350_9AGAR|nr:major facilitator superfamily domain-containing protein [Mycena metata]